MKILRRTAWGFGLTAVLIAGATLASHPAMAEWTGLTILPDDPEVIYACYVPGSGSLYRIKADDPTETCKSPNHDELHWNVVGLEGPQGPQGPIGPVGVAGPQGAQGPLGSAGPAGTAGPLGAQGPTGAAGISGYEVVTVQVEHPFESFDEIVVAHCPAGKKVIGGGYKLDPMVGRVQRNNPDAGNDGWYVWIDNLALNTPTVAAYAICANMAS